MQESEMGGIEYNSLHLARGLDSSRFLVSFLCPGEGKLPGKLRAENFPVIFYRRPRFFSTSFRAGGKTILNPFTTLFNFLAFPFIAFSLAAKIKENKFDAVVTKGLLANFYGALGARLASRPCVWDMQEIVSSKRCFGFFSFVLNFAAGVCASRLIAPSGAIVSQFWTRTREKITIVANGVDTDFYKPRPADATFRKMLGAGEGQILIAHVARFTYWKGQLDFVRACQKIATKFDQARFVLAGSPVFENDNYEKEVKSLVAELGIGGKTVFPGFQEDLAAVLAAADIFVHSSTEPEGCPITLITAMSMAKPVVATNVLGNDEIIQDASQGLLVPPGNPEAMAGALEKIIQDQALAASLGESARKRILAAYSLQNYARASAKVFEEIAGSKS